MPLQLLQYNREFEPTLVMCPCSADIHQDHNVVYQETCRIFRRCSILGYELPWNATAFRPQYFVPLAPVDVDAKLTALSKYESQDLKQYMEDDTIEANMRVRGLQCGHPYAEAFEVIRWIDQ